MYHRVIRPLKNKDVRKTDIILNYIGLIKSLKPHKSSEVTGRDGSATSGELLKTILLQFPLLETLWNPVLENEQKQDDWTISKRIKIFEID